MTKVFQALSETERADYGHGVADYRAGRPNSAPPQVGLSYARMGWLDARDVTEAYSRAAAGALTAEQVYGEANGTTKPAPEAAP